MSMTNVYHSTDHQVIKRLPLVRITRLLNVYRSADHQVIKRLPLDGSPGY